MELLGRTGKHARVAVLTIIEEEFEAARQEFGTQRHVSAGDYWVHELEPGRASYPVVVARSYDRTNLATQQSVTDLLEDWRPEFLILCGIAGGIRRARASKDPKGPKLGDLIIGTYIHNAEYNKADKGELIPRYLALAHPSMTLVSKHCRPLARTHHWPDGLINARPSNAPPRWHEGEIVAVDSIVGDPRNVHHAAIARRYDKALAVDMESAGIGIAMHAYQNDVHYNPRWLCIRAISDVVTFSDDPQAEVEDPNEVREDWREPAALTAASFSHGVVKALLANDRPPSQADPGAPAYNPSQVPPIETNDQPGPEPPELSEPGSILGECQP